jgi:hypothetical protein
LWGKGPCSPTGVLCGSLSPDVIGQKIGTIQKNDTFYEFFLFFADYPISHPATVFGKSFLPFAPLFFVDCPVFPEFQKVKF